MIGQRSITVDINSILIQLSFSTQQFNPNPNSTCQKETTVYFQRAHTQLSLLKMQFIAIS